MVFLSHLWLVIVWAAKHWWEWIWVNVIMVAIFAALTYLADKFLLPKLVIHWPFLTRFAGDSTMDSIGQGLILGALASILLFIVFLALAPSRIHSELVAALQQSREDLQATKSELQAAKEQYKPGLSGMFLQAFVNTFNHGSHEFAGAIFVIRVLNTGNPSIATGFDSTVMLADGRKVSGELGRLDVPMTLKCGEGNPSLVFQPDDALDVKCIERPIAQGDQVTGYLLLKFSGLTVDEVGEAVLQKRFAISFYDALGRPHEVAAEDLRTDMAARLIPGMKTILRHPAQASQSNSDNAS